MKCPNCQAENRDGAKFCEQCATALARRCPNCGAEVGPIARFCDQCAYDLTKPKPTPIIDYSKPQTYTPKFLADKILTARQSLEGERKLVTILFADVAGYTSMSEKLDPEEVHQIMDGCFKVLLDEIHRYEGTIDKFTGDGVMALFGAPVAHEDHAQRACYAALAIQRALDEYGAKVKKECGVDFKMRVGLNSGPVIVGSVGSDLKMDYTAIGDTVNLASRMETAAKPGAVLVSEHTYRMARDFFEFQSLGKVKVKGKEEPVEAYQLLKASQVATRIEAAAVRGLTEFVGREREMAALQEAFEKARSGSGQVVGMVGEAGVGKSRLLLELRRRLPEGEYTYLEGRCLHYGGSMPYLPFLDVLRSYFDIEEGDREFIIKKKMAEKAGQLDEKLKGVLPPLQDILSLKVEDEEYLKLDPPLKRVKIFESIRDLLIRESQSKPLILAVEGLQWIDRTSEEFLTYLIGWLANTHILLMLLYRPEYTHTWGSKSYYRQIGVDQLSLASSAELVQSILQGGEVMPEVRELILTRATGNPLFMEEFTHTLLENGSIQKKDHEYVLSRKASDIQVPDTIQGIIAARMDRLEESLKRTMQVASVIGRDFAFRVLQTITGMREELKSYLLDLQGLEFIYEKSLFPELEYIFKNALTQEVAYNSLLLKRRKEIHEKIGKAIEELYPDRLEEFYEMLAHHYSRSENLEKAYQYLLLSAMKVGFNYSLWEAFRFGKEAINVLNQMPQTEENKRRGIDGRLLLGLVMSGLGYPEDSLEILQEGERLSKELGDERSLVNCYSSIAMCYAYKGDLPQGRKYAEEAFQGAEKIGDIELLAPIGVDLCMVYSWAGEFSRTVEVAPQVIGSLEKTQKEAEFFGRPFNPYSALLALYGLAIGYLGDFGAGEALCEKGLRVALEINNLISIGMAEVYYSALFCVKGDGRNAVEHGQNAVRCGEETQAVTSLAPAWMCLGWGHYFLGELGRAMECSQKGLGMQREAGFSPDLPSFYQCLGSSYLDSGDLAKARGCFEEALDLSQKNPQRHWEGQSRYLLGSVLGETGPSQYGKAEEYILQGMGICDELKLKPYRSIAHLFLGELYADMGQREKALEALKKAQGMLQEMGMDYWLARTDKALEKLQRGVQ